METNLKPLNGKGWNIFFGTIPGEASRTKDDKYANLSFVTSWNLHNGHLTSM